MELGYRIIRPSDVGSHPLPFVQISLWRAANWGVSDGERGVAEAIAMARACKERNIRSVFHPLEYPLTNEHGDGTMAVLRRLAGVCDCGIIIHDEGGKNGARLSEADARRYEQSVLEIGALCPISIENSYNSGDIIWFWERFVLPAPPSVSITLDIGHIELAGLDSVVFVRALKKVLVDRISFVHLHHHDARTGDAVPDHKPLVKGCREIEALRELLKRKNDIGVILELDAAEDGLEQSIELLSPLRDGS